MESLDSTQLADILERAVGRGNARIAFEAFQRPSSVSVRLNPSKVSEPEAFVAENFGEGAEKVPWSPFGYILKERPQFTLDPLFHAGCYYVQDSSAMAAGQIFREQFSRFKGLDRPLRVLDLCAAPGGKTTDLAASLRQSFGDGFFLAGNEVMRNRASVLADNIAIWGDPNVVVTCLDPKAFASLEGFFDIILADVPCSGEGMFRKDEKAVEDWSMEAVSLCAARQKRILADVWPALREGGILVYSTCTFEEAENDLNMEWAAEELGGKVIEYDFGSLPGVIKTRCGGLLVPGFVKGEGQYVSALEKTAPAREYKSSARGARMTEKRKDGLVLNIPESIAREAAALEVLRPIRTGLAIGTLKGKDLIPSADLALSISAEKDRFPRTGLDRETALKFLHRDSITVKDAPEGFVMVCYEGHPLGFVKNLGSRCNNMHPLNRRIRMDL